MVEAGSKAARDERRKGPIVIAGVALVLIGLPIFSWLDLRDLSERMLRVQAGEIGRIIDQMRG